MKGLYRPSPNYREGSNTRQIMMELTIALLVVFAFALFNQYTLHGVANVMHSLLMLLSGVATSIIVEAFWAKFVVKVSVGQYLKNSFPWVTAIILVLMLPVNMGIYPIVIGTLFAIVVTKLLFGGFGQNVFNPAAAGCAVIFSFFSTNVAADIITAATPTKTIAATYGWLINSPDLINEFLTQFKGLGSLLLGTYDGALGETCSLLLIIIAIYLAVRKIIDWRVPVFYVLTVFGLTAIVGLMHGTGIWYPVFHVLTGGLLFGAVFMATDPVTTPTSAAGKIIYAIGCGLLTVIIRLRGSLPEGVLFSILIMNMLTPWIERVCSGVQFKITRKMIGVDSCILVVAIILTVVISNGMTPIVPEVPEEVKFLNADQHLLIYGDHSEHPAKVTDTKKKGDEIIYTVEAEGYAYGHYDNPKPCVYEIVINKKTNTIVSVAYITFRDTEYVGDKTKNAEFLDQFAGLSITDETAGVDACTGATITSDTVVSAVEAAVRKALK